MTQTRLIARPDDPLDFRGKRYFLARQFTAVPERRLHTLIEACGGAVTPYFRQRNLTIEVVILGNKTYGPKWETAEDFEVVRLSEAEVCNHLGVNDSPSERLERLRDLSHQPFDEDVWYKVLCILECWPLDQQIALGLDYVNHHFDGARGEGRVGLMRWYKRARSGQPEPRLRVVRHVHMGLQHAGPGLVTRMFDDAAFRARVEHIDVSGNNLGDADLIKLTEAGRFDALESLNLDHNDITDKGAQHLAASKAFPRLKQLSLARCKLSDAGRKAIRESRKLPRGLPVNYASARWFRPWTQRKRRY